MKKFNWNWLRILVYILSGVFVGVLLCNYTFFEFDKKINLVELLNVLITAFVALFLTIYIQDRQSKEQKEKEFIISEINELLSFVQEIKEYSKSNIYPFEEIKSTFKDFNIQHQFIAEIISNSANEEIGAISAQIKSLRRLITKESPIAGNISMDTISKKNLVDKKLYSLKLGVFNLLKSVNRKH